MPLLDASVSEICDALIAYEGREDRVRFELYDYDDSRTHYFFVDLDVISSAKFDFGDYLLKRFNVAAKNQEAGTQQIEAVSNE